MINNRQAGRRRGRGGQQQRPQGGGSGRPDNGNRIDNRARGNAAQMLEKYKTLARDAQMQGDRVNVEYYLQFADHYFRVLAETRARFEENGGQSTGRRPQGATLDEDEQDYEDEGDRGLPNEQRQPEQRMAEQGQRQDGYRAQDGNRDGGNRESGDRGSQNGNSYNNGGNGQRDPQRDGQRENSRDGQRDFSRDGQRASSRDGQRDGQRDDRPRGRANGNGGDHREAESAATQGDRNDYARPDPRDRAPEPEAQYQPVQAATTEVAAPRAPADGEPPRRGRGRPRREVPVDAVPAPAFQSEDRLPAMSLPPALNLPASVSSDADGDVATEEKPRRRRGRPPANATPVE